MFSGSERVLIVDDDPHIAHGASLRLGAAGYQTSFARDGCEALEQVASSAPDVVVMDVHMPRMGGIEALQALKAGVATAAIPIVMLSASISDEQVALDAGARFFVRKPYTSQELVTAVQNARSVDTPCS